MLNAFLANMADITVPKRPTLSVTFTIAFAISKKDKILQKRIEHLEKKGYKVEKLPEPEEEVDEDDAVVMKKAK